MLSLDLRQSLLGVNASLLCLLSRRKVCVLSISSLLSLVNLVRVKIYRHIYDVSEFLLLLSFSSFSL